MQALAERALVDDIRFAQLWSDSRDANNPRSAEAIRRELISKGVAGDIAEATAQNVDDRHGAYKAGYKRARQLEQTDYVTFRRRLWRYLQRRGFGASVIRETISRLWEERGV